MKIKLSRILVEKIVSIFFIGCFIFSKEYDLESLIKIGLENNSSIKIAKEDKKKALANSIEARSAALPRVHFFTSGTKNYEIAGQPMDFPIPFGVLNAETGQPVPTQWNPGLQQTEIIPYETIFSVGRDYSAAYGLNINQTLFDGRVFTAIRASNVYNKLTEESYNVQVTRAIESIKISYYSVLLTKKITQVFKKSLDRSKSNFNNTKLLFDSGKVNELELIRAESLVKDQESFLKNAEKNEVLAIENLCITVGFSNSNSLKILGDFFNIDLNIPSFESIELDLIKNQPQFKQLDANYYLFKENINLFYAEFLPSIGFSGSLHRVQSNNKKNFIFNNFQNNSSVSINISLPIFDGFSSLARVNKAKADARKAKYQAEDIKKKLILELKSIYLDLNESKEKINASKKKIELAEKGYKIANDLFQNGMTTQLELLSAEISLNQAELNLIQSKFEYQIAMARLSRAIGENILGIN